jgi:hypothetical protein
MLFCFVPQHFKNIVPDIRNMLTLILDFRILKDKNGLKRLKIKKIAVSKFDRVLSYIKISINSTNFSTFSAKAGNTIYY